MILRRRRHARQKAESDERGFNMQGAWTTQQPVGVADADESQARRWEECRCCAGAGTGAMPGPGWRWSVLRGLGIYKHQHDLPDQMNY